MRLIDADDVISVICYHYFFDDKDNFDLFIRHLFDEIKQIPTAYDIGKVVEGLENTKNHKSRIGCTNRLISKDKAIEIVKAGK